MAEKLITDEKVDFDEENILRQAQVNPQAFKSIYQKYFKQIFLFVLHRMGDKQLAADVTQQVFLKALTNLPKFQFRGLPFSAWLYRISLNECNDYFRKTKKARLVVLDEKASSTLFEELTYDVTQDELEMKLPDMLGKLKEAELQLIQLRFFESRSFKEIGDILEMKEVNVKVKTYRVLEKMKKLFVEK